ncbi:MAG: alkaline phosphatase [Saprospiraceae bacterium]
MPGGWSPRHAVEHPRNVILLIGDGMGLSQISAGFYANKQTLNLQRMQVTGLQKTHAYGSLITDSAAAGTAMACGCKTRNKYLGVNHKKQRCTSIFESAQKKGLATGLVVTSSITHATPAAFYAHIDNRYTMEEIAAQFAKQPTDCFIGGGMKYFSTRSDGRNLLDTLQSKGWNIQSYKDKKLKDLNPAPASPFGWFSAWEEPGSISKNEAYLKLGTEKAIEFLAQKSKTGFICMVEGSQIDWACHQNQANQAIKELIEFDQTLGAVLDFAERDGNTLVLVTADHETGGMALGQGRGPDSLDIEFNSKKHTGTMVPVFAFGPGAWSFSGVYDNTVLHALMMEALQLN